MKLWIKTIKGEKITNSVIYQVHGVYDPKNLTQYLTDICFGLDIPRPIIIEKHIKDMENFNHTIFKTNDFVENVDFDKLWIEVAISKNKKSDNFYSNLWYGEQKMRKVVKFEGITILYEKNTLNKATYCDFGIDCGAFCDDILGESHYLEHLFFTETPSKSHEEILKLKFLNRINAHTSFDEIKISFDQSSSLIDECFEICSDLFFNSAINNMYVNKEREIIKSEINRRHVDPRDMFEMEYRAKLLNEKRFLYSPAGKAENIDKITTQKLNEIRKKYFFRENFSITIYTNKSLGYIKKLAKEYILPKLNSKEEKLPNTDDLDFVNKSFLNITKKDINDNIVLLNFCKIPTPQSKKEKLKTFTLLQYVNSLLFSKRLVKIREEKSYVYSFSQYRKATPREYVFGIKFQTKNEFIKPCLKEISKIICETKESGFSEEEFNDYVTKTKLSEDMEFSTPGDAIRSLRGQYLTYKELLEKKVLKKLFYSITLDEVNSFIKKALEFNNYYLSILTNTQTEKKLLPTEKEIKALFTKKE